MREILFRAKHIHALPQNEHLDGTWVYGYLCYENYINTVDEDKYGGKFTSEILIDPETVCQYTGLIDRNGRKIFEGDIVKHNISDTIGTVKWYCEDYAGWCVDDIHIGEQQFTDEMWNECEVIGNIFDNPELIGEQP